MADECRYFRYQLPNSGVVFIGTERQQITRTLEHYRANGKLNDASGNLQIPPETDFLEMQEDIEVVCVFPLGSKRQFVDARIRPRAVFHINANAFDYVGAAGRDYERKKRGELYKFETVKIMGLWFLPEDVMQGLRDYDWTQHTAQIDQWLDKRGAMLEEGKR